MNKNRDIEALLRELHEGETAGVFRPTAVDRVRAAVAHSARRTRLTEWAWRCAAAAACVALGIWGWDAFSPRGQNVNKMVSAARGGGLDVARCLTGPGVAADPDCLSLDLDQDGDVDLADIRRMQLDQPSGNPNPS